MDQNHATELVARERARVEAALAALDRDGPLEGSENDEPGDQGTEDLYQDEVDEGRRTELNAQLAAVVRAEARLADGTYGRSVDRGDPIPDARLEALPLAERTVDEEERYRRGG
jgi:DnaK suppressor protein